MVEATEISAVTIQSVDGNSAEKDDPKPRTVLFQGGGDDVSTTAFAKIDPATNSNILMVGTIALKIPSPEAKPDEVRPTFRTPCVA